MTQPKIPGFSFTEYIRKKAPFLASQSHHSSFIALAILWLMMHAIAILAGSYEHLTAESIRGNAERSLEFKEDKNIPEPLRATLADYRGRGFDRGHMAPAADHRSSKEAMTDTFFMTNMCPQCTQLNRGYWAKLEKHVRDLTKEYQNIYVVTGPLYLPQQESDGKRYVRYQVIGPNDVAVPTHFFKVITLEDKEVRAYVLPNQEIPSKTPLDSFKTTVQKVEKLAEFVFAR